MNLITRLIIFLVFLVGIYFLPWWLLFAAAFVVMLIKRAVLFELLIPAFLVDVVYGVPIERFNNFQFVATSIMVGILLVILLIKKYVRV